MCGVQEGSIFCLVNAIAIAEYKTGDRNNGAIDTNVAWSQVYAPIAFWLEKRLQGILSNNTCYYHSVQISVLKTEECLSLLQKAKSKW